MPKYHRSNTKFTYFKLMFKKGNFNHLLENTSLVIFSILRWKVTPQNATNNCLNKLLETLRDFLREEMNNLFIYY